MCKKLFVFWLAFCLGLIASQTIKRTEYFCSQNTSNLADINSIQSVNEKIVDISAPLNSKNFEEEKNRFRAAGLDDEKEVINFFTNFQRAVAEDDRRTVASMMNYPLFVLYASAHYRLMKNQTVYGSRIKNKAIFLKNYDRIFDDDFKKFISDVKLEELGAMYSGVKTPRGEIWINGICKDSSCKDAEIKFTTLNSGSVFIDRPILIKSKNDAN
jgi:hypothetical protein